MCIDEYRNKNSWEFAPVSRPRSSEASHPRQGPRLAEASILPRGSRIHDGPPTFKQKPRAFKREFDENTPSTSSSRPDQLYNIDASRYSRPGSPYPVPSGSGYDHRRDGTRSSSRHRYSTLPEVHPRRRRSRSPSPQRTRYVVLSRHHEGGSSRDYYDNRKTRRSRSPEREHRRH